MDREPTQSSVLESVLRSARCTTEEGRPVKLHRIITGSEIPAAKLLFDHKDGCEVTKPVFLIFADRVVRPFPTLLLLLGLLAVFVFSDKKR